MPVELGKHGVLRHDHTADRHVVSVEPCWVSAKAGNMGVVAHESVQNDARVGVSQTIRIEGVALAAVLQATVSINRPESIQATRFVDEQFTR